jgi:hypothetical protein
VDLSFWVDIASSYVTEEQLTSKYIFNCNFPALRKVRKEYAVKC